MLAVSHISQNLCLGCQSEAITISCFVARGHTQVYDTIWEAAAKSGPGATETMACMTFVYFQACYWAFLPYLVHPMNQCNHSNHHSLDSYESVLIHLSR